MSNFSVDIRPQTFEISLQSSAGGSYSGNQFEYIRMIDAYNQQIRYLQVYNGILYVLTNVL